MDILIEKNGVAVDDDQPTHYQFNGLFEQRYREAVGLELDDVLIIGKNIYEEVFRTADRRAHFARALSESGSKPLLVRIISRDDFLRNIPFELMNTSGSMPDFLYRNGRIRVIRVRPADPM